MDVAMEQQNNTPQLQIRANRRALARYGIGIDDFNSFVDLAFSGEKVADIYEGAAQFSTCDTPERELYPKY